jgi:hypothetical protein
MTQGEQAAIAVALGTVFGFGLWLYGRWQRGEIKWAAVAFVALGAAVWAVAIAAIFMSRSAATYLVPSAILLVGGLYLYGRAGPSRWQQLAAAAGAILGLVGLVGGVFRMFGSG